MANTLNELPVLLGAIYGGLIIGVLYDVFRVLRLPFRSKWIVGILDALYYIAAGILAALVMLTINGGRLRVYAIAGLLVGAIVYIKFVSGLLIDLVSLILRLFRKK